MDRLGSCNQHVGPVVVDPERRCHLADGRVSFHVQDPDNAYRTLEVRGRVESMDPDPDAAFYRSLQRHYGSEGVPVLDAEVRVVIVIKPTNYVSVSGGLTELEIEAVTALLEQVQGGRLIRWHRECPTRPPVSAHPGRADETGGCCRSDEVAAAGAVRSAGQTTGHGRCRG